MTTSEAARILDLPEGFSREDLRAAYRFLVKVYHPDRFENDIEAQARATEKLKHIGAAKTVLLCFLDAAESSGGQSPNAPDRQPERPKPDQSPEPGVFRRVDPATGSITFVKETSLSPIDGERFWHPGIIRQCSPAQVSNVTWAHARKAFLAFSVDPKRHKVRRDSHYDGLDGTYTELEEMQDGSTISITRSRIPTDTLAKDIADYDRLLADGVLPSALAVARLIREKCQKDLIGILLESECLVRLGRVWDARSAIRDGMAEVHSEKRALAAAAEGEVSKLFIQAAEIEVLIENHPGAKSILKQARDRFGRQSVEDAIVASARLEPIHKWAQRFYWF